MLRWPRQVNYWHRLLAMQADFHISSKNILSISPMLTRSRKAWTIRSFSSASDGVTQCASQSMANSFRVIFVASMG